MNTTRNRSHVLSLCSWGALVAALHCGSTVHANEAAAHLHVRTATRGAIISIDGKEIGRAPLREPVPVVAGKHVVRVAKPGYTVFLEAVEVKPGRTKRMTVDLLPIKGVLKVTANVDRARVYLDKKFVGRVPVELELEPGRHDLRVSHTGYSDVVRHFQAKAGRVARLRAKLVPVGNSGVKVERQTKLSEKKWYQKWWFWASIAGGALAIGLSVTLPLALLPEEPGKDFRADRVFIVP